MIVQTHPPLASPGAQLVGGSWGCTAVLWTVLTYPSDTGHRNSITAAFRHNCLNYLCGLLQILSKICDPRWQYPLFMWEALFKLQSPLGTRPAGQQGRNPYASMVKTTISLEAPAETKIFCCDIPSTPLLLENRAVLSYREAKREGKRGDVQVKGVWHAQRLRDKNHDFSQPSLLFYTRRFSQGYHFSKTPLPVGFQTQTLPFPFTFTDKRSFCLFSLSILRRNIVLPLIFAVFSQRRLRRPCNINPVLPPRTRGCSKGGRSLPFWLLPLTHKS